MSHNLFAKAIDPPYFFLENLQLIHGSFTSSKPHTNKNSSEKKMIQEFVTFWIKSCPSLIKKKKKKLPETLGSQS